VAKNGGNSEISMRRLHSGKTTGAENADPDHEAALRITGSVREMIQYHADTNPAFREVLRQDAIDCIRTGDPETGQALLRNYFRENEAAEHAPIAGMEP
jgi:hypothetical protein